MCTDARNDLRAYVDNRRRSFSPSSENEEILENDA